MCIESTSYGRGIKQPNGQNDFISLSCQSLILVIPLLAQWAHEWSSQGWKIWLDPTSCSPTWFIRKSKRALVMGPWPKDPLVPSHITPHRSCQPHRGFWRNSWGTSLEMMPKSIRHHFPRSSKHLNQGFLNGAVSLVGRKHVGTHWKLRGKI